MLAPFFFLELPHPSEYGSFFSLWQSHHVASKNIYKSRLLGIFAGCGFLPFTITACSLARPLVFLSFCHVLTGNSFRKKGGPIAKGTMLWFHFGGNSKQTYCTWHRRACINPEITVKTCTRKKFSCIKFPKNMAAWQVAWFPTARTFFVSLGITKLSPASAMLARISQVDMPNTMRS